MKIRLKYLPLISMLIVSQPLTCITNNKTFLSYAPETAVPKISLDTLKRPKHNHDLSIRYAYTHSYDDKKLRSYFFPYSKQQLLFGDRDSIDNPNRDSVDLAYNFFIHTSDAGSRNVTLSMKPEQQTHYVEANYYHTFSICNAPLFFMIHVPVINVSNQLNPSFTPQNFPSDVAPNPDDLSNFFAGNFTNTNTRKLQAPLQSLTFTNGKNTSCGIADMSFLVGWLIAQDKTFQANLAAGITLPTSNKPKGRVLFEPLRGNNGHWGITLHGECTKQLQIQNDLSLEINTMTDLLYLIPNNQTRTAGIRSLAWGQYALLGKNGAINEPIFPAANVLTGEVKVTPGIQATSMVTTTLVNPYVNVGIGYSLFIKGEEGVGLNKDQFPEETYGIAAFDYDTTTEFTQATAQNGYWLRADDIDVTSAQTPSQVIHGIHCAFTKIIEQNTIAWKVNTGVQTSFAQQNTAPVGYTIWALLGLYF